MAKKTTKKKRTRKPKTTQSFKTFEINIQRASFFLDIQEERQALQGMGAPPTPYRELPRGAVVFAVGSLDTYLSEVSAELLIADLSKSKNTTDARNVLKDVQKDLPTIAIEVALLNKSEDRIEYIQNAITNHFYNKVSMHGSKAVANTMSRTASEAKDLWSSLKSKDYDKPAKTLDEWTQKRHEIVHQGKKLRILRPQARDCIDLIKAIATEVDAFAMKA